MWWNLYSREPWSLQAFVPSSTSSWLCVEALAVPCPPGVCSSLSAREAVLSTCHTLWPLCQMSLEFLLWPKTLEGWENLKVLCLHALPHSLPRDSPRDSCLRSARSGDQRLGTGLGRVWQEPGCPSRSPHDWALHGAIWKLCVHTTQGKAIVSSQRVGRVLKHFKNYLSVHVCST